VYVEDNSSDEDGENKAGAKVGDGQEAEEVKEYSGDDDDNDDDYHDDSAEKLARQILDSRKRLGKPKSSYQQDLGSDSDSER